MTTHLKNRGLTANEEQSGRDVRRLQCGRKSDLAVRGKAQSTPQASIIWFRTAYRTSSLTEWISSLRIMLARCVSAVFTLMPRTDATSLLLLPSESNCTTSRSRAVNRLPGSSSQSSGEPAWLKLVSITSVALDVKNGL